MVKGTSHQQNGGSRGLLGATYQGLAVYRISLGLLLLSELLLRFRFLHAFYSDEGTLPLRLLMPKVDNLYHIACLHCLFGDLWFQEVLLYIQCLAAAAFTIGYKTRLMAIVSWFLYLSLTLRNTWLNFILDRYFHYLLFYAMLLPLDRHWALQTSSKTQKDSNSFFVSFATIALKLQVLWIYLDAGWGKLTDPKKGWTYGADPLPALDTYARHTIGARYLYALLRPPGLRLLTPVVVWVELLAAPTALLGNYLGSTILSFIAIVFVCGLHIGIAISVRNTILLSLVACAPWSIFLPGHKKNIEAGHNKSNQGGERTPNEAFSERFLGKMVKFALIATSVIGSVWIDAFSASCDQSTKHIWSTLFHNRWNVFVGAEEYVTWEIAPGLLRDGSVVDVWGRRDTVSWKMPGSGAPSTSTARPGRWRSFPYLAELDGEDGEILWNYLCYQWDTEHNVTASDPSRQLVKFNFFMLQADVLPNMGFSATRKRLIKSHECLKDTETTFSIEATGDPPINEGVSLNEEL